MIKHFLYSSMIGIVLSISSCHAMNATRAERCVFVDLQGQQGRKLIPLLDSFAKNLDLEPDKSHPINPRYVRKLNGVLEAEVSYDIGVGPFGAGLSLFLYDKTHNADLVEQFDRYVEDVIATKYTVTQCKPEQYPTTYR